MGAALKTVTAPRGWTHSDPNPFSSDGAYGLAWSAFCILDRDDDQFVTGRSADGPFSARFGRRVPHLHNRLADFLRYENAHGRTVILSFPEDIDAGSFVAQAAACTPAANVFRAQDPAVIVHATTTEAWQSIQADGALKAAARLERMQKDAPDTAKPGAIADYLRGEPPEYSDYIMFGVVDSCVPEMVVASNQAGEWVLNAQAVFQPGVRLFFDNRRIIQDGRGTRDGLHVMKVRGVLPLQPYLLCAVGIQDLDPGGSQREWTLRGFVEQANEFFSRRDCSSRMPAG